MIACSSQKVFFLKSNKLSIAHSLFKLPVNNYRRSMYVMYSDDNGNSNRERMSHLREKGNHHLPKGVIGNVPAVKLLKGKEKSS